MIYLYKLQRILDVITSKNVADITRRNVYIPFLGNDYTEAQLRAWLDKRTNLLNNVKLNNLTDNQVNQLKTTLYNSLTDTDKLIADKILVGQPYDLNPSGADAYDKLIGMILYVLITTP